MSPLALLCAAAIAHPALAQDRAAHPLDTVRVTSRSDAELGDEHSIRRGDHARWTSRGARRARCPIVLAVALGVDAQQRSPAQADLGLRGSTFNQVVVLVDGVRVSDVQSGHYALDLAVPVAMIERIEILRGTGSALYGSDAIGGVVNIVTRSDTSFAELATRVGSFGGANGRVALGATSKGTALRLGADMDRSERSSRRHRLPHHAGAAARRAPGGQPRASRRTSGLARGSSARRTSTRPIRRTRRREAPPPIVRARAPLSSRVSLDGAVHTRRHSDVFTLKRDDPAFYQNTHLSWQSGAEATAAASRRQSACVSRQGASCSTRG